MGWFRWLRRNRTDEPDPNERMAKELMDQYHRRASLADGDRMVIAPGKVLENIAEAMERVDLDIDTAISIEEDVASHDELLMLVERLAMGPALAVHVVNNAMRIMEARYPPALVHGPLPPHYDLRRISPIEISDHLHGIAVNIFNQRTVSPADLSPDDITADFAPLDGADQMTVFVALFYMYGTKVGALKNVTGID